ncbi:MAG: tRNA guanosine(34) transglycosylase Tgt [Pseudomonadota bacterium]
MQQPYFRFEIIHQSKRSKARVGRIHTPHGVIDTPCFVGVGTNGSLKAIDNLDPCMEDLSLMFCNTYHMMVQPGTALVKEFGGLHTFINRKGPLITDSGGFQVFSLAYGGVANEIKSRGVKKNDGCVLKITEEGVTFRSYRDGQKIFLSPETSVQAQKDLAADIIIPLDELPPFHIKARSLLEALHRTHRWEERSLRYHLAQPQQQAMYAVIHGGIDPELRAFSCRTLTQQPFDGFAIGGSLGRNTAEMIQTVTDTVPHLPDPFPRHLLGIADLPSLAACIPLGIDSFDSAYPTRAARHGTLFTDQGNLKIEQGRYRNQAGPIEPGCPCSTCTQYHVSYLHHLFKAREPIILTLLSRHNVVYMTRYMKRMREAICADTC